MIPCQDIETKDEPQEIKGTLPLDEMEKLVSRHIFTSGLLKFHFRFHSIILPVEKTGKRALRDYEPDFQWVPTHRVDFKALQPNIWMNHFRKADFVTKTGLTERLKSTRWHSDRNPDEFFPKCYILGKSIDLRSYILYIVDPGLYNLDHRSYIIDIRSYNLEIVRMDLKIFFR